MPVQVNEFNLLVEIQKHLQFEGSRPDLAAALLKTLNRMNRELEREWARKHRPGAAPASVKKKLAAEDIPLMQRLLDEGYPREDMDHHESDLYVYVTPLTTQVVEQWCREHEFDRTWHCPTFYEQQTGRLMYDCAFQYFELAEETA